jgi:hypothetical protein
VPIISAATAPQNLHAEFPAQAGDRSAKSFGLFLDQSGAVIQFFRVERSRIRQQAGNPLPHEWR